jgi:hypothetical protein
MSRYLQIKKDLFLVEQEVSKANAVPTPDTTNHIWIYDRSGSMYSLLGQLTEDLTARAKELEKGDTLTLGWFSSEGQFNWIIKGYKVTDAKDQQVLEGLIRKNNTTIGMTCFSEILKDTNQVVDDLSALNPNFALTFFSDGYPVVSNYSREIESIQMAIKQVGGKISAALLVGYGPYYNKELMSSMAEQFGGALVHSADLKSFNVTMSDFIRDSREGGLKVKVNLEHKSPLGLYFGVNGKSINLYQDNGGSVSFVPTKNARDFLFVLTDRLTGKEEEVTEKDLETLGERNSLWKGAYAAACLLTQKTKTDTAMEVLALLGDKGLVDAVNNAFTNDEYGAAEARITTAMAAPSERFLQGKVKNYLPKEDAFCLLDALSLLMDDSEAYFYPYDSAFEYKRIGVPSKTKPGYAKFEAEKGARAPLNSLTWNSSKLNLSVLAKIQGTVELKDGHQKFGLVKDYPTFIFRNYTLVKDGFLNVQKLPVSVSEQTFAVLQAQNVIDVRASWGQDKVVLLHLDRIPVINRAIAKGKTSATELCRKSYQETVLEGKIKAIKYLRNALVESEESTGKALSSDQEKFLADNGIGKSGFSPPTEKEEPTDFYLAKEFEIKIKGLSSLPSVNKVLGATKALTPSEKLVKAGLEVFDKSGLAKADPKVQLAWFDSTLAQYKGELAAVRREIQETKFAVILAKASFDELTSREDNELDVDGQHFTISLRSVKVAI